jgi:hypothetical protein
MKLKGTGEEQKKNGKVRQNDRRKNELKKKALEAI